MSTPRLQISRLEIAALTASIMMFVGVVYVFQLVFRDPSQPLRDQHIAAITALTQEVPHSMSLSTDTAAVTITDQTEVANFIHLILAPQPVPRHHSHPEGFIRVAFQGYPSTYLLGRDSQVPDEYWLNLYDGADSLLNVKQFRSTAMTSWLGRLDLSSPPGGTPSSPVGN